MNVQWIKGEVLPPESGEYYIAIEAQQDIGEGWFAKGDVEITTDYFNKDSGYFDTIGGPNDYWKVLCWADILNSAIVLTALVQFPILATVTCQIPIRISPTPAPIKTVVGHLAATMCAVRTRRFIHCLHQLFPLNTS